MKKIFILPVFLVLGSCSQESHPIHKHYTTYSVQSGNVLMTDTLLAQVEGEKTSELGFRTAGVISEISVKLGENVKKGQILAILGNNESVIQSQGLKKVEGELKNIGDTTREIHDGTRDLAITTKNLYDERLKSLDTQISNLENVLKKNEQSLFNQKGGISENLKNFLTGFDRISTSDLYEGDKILGITTNFEYTNDEWESYLGVRIGDSKANAVNSWNALYSARGTVRKYIESSGSIDPNYVIQDLSHAYDVLRKYGTNMNTMLQNTAIGGGMNQERLDNWIRVWSGLNTEIQQAESEFISWKNNVSSILIISNGSTVAEKDIDSIGFELETLKQSKNTLLAEKELKIKEIETNLSTIKAKKGEISLQIVQTEMNGDLADESIEYNIIRAPYDGVILRKYSEVGMVVGAGNPVLQITKTGTRYAKIYIDNDLYQYIPGSIIRMRKDVSPEETFTGKISLIQDQKDPLSNKNYTEIQFKNSHQFGERIQLEFTRSVGVEHGGIVIPRDAIITRYGPPGVYVLSGGVVGFRFIRLISSDNSSSEVSGVYAGESIIVEGKENIYDGEKLY